MILDPVIPMFVFFFPVRTNEVEPDRKVVVGHNTNWYHMKQPNSSWGTIFEDQEVLVVSDQSLTDIRVKDLSCDGSYSNTIH